MRKIFQYILMSVALVATASCSNELDETLQPAHNGTLQFVVSDFPAFGENSETRAIGTEDPGKTAWEKDDEIIITLASQKFGTQSAAITYDGTSWSTAASLSYIENETPTISVIYAPCYEVTKAGVMQLKEGMQLGMSEYLVGDCIGIVDGVMTITFEGAGHRRDYSRLRIAGLAKQTLTVTTTDFIPAGMNESGEYTYTLTTDDKGNAYLYGIFAEGATVSVKQGEVTLKDYTFTAEKNPNGTEHNKSYVLDATPVIDGTLGGKATAEESDITALVEKLKEYVDNGITTITVTGSNPAMITITENSYTCTITAIGEAIYRLSGSGDEKNSTYLGKIDLILPDVTEIVDWEFLNAYALNSITLPKVTTVGDNAFYNCWYLQELTFGSVVTLIKSELAFSGVGRYVDGGLCHLVLNIGQTTAAAEYQPNIETKEWWNTPWKHITLI